MTSEDTAVRLGEMTGANAILTGSYSVVNDKVRIIAKLVSVESGAVMNSAILDGAMDDIFALQDKVVFQLFAEVEKINAEDIPAIQITAKEIRSIEEAYVPQMSAYELYSKGLETRDTDPAKALEYFEKAISIDPNYADALINAGWIAGNTLNKFDKSLEYLNKALNLTIVEYGENNEKTAFVYNSFGAVYSDKGNIDLTLEYYLKSRDIMDALRMQNTDGYAGLMNNIGIVYSDKGNLDLAMEYYQKSRDNYDTLGLQNTDGYAALMMNIGAVYSDKGNIDLGLEYYLKSGNIREALGLQNTDGYADLMMNIGVVYQQKGNIDLTIEYYIKSRDIYDTLGLQNTLEYGILLIWNMALLYEEMGNNAQAGRYWRKAYEIFKSLGYTDYAQIALKSVERLGY